MQIYLIKGEFSTVLIYLPDNIVKLYFEKEKREGGIFFQRSQLFQVCTNPKQLKVQN